MREYFRHNEILVILCIQIVLMMMGMGLVSPILPQYARSFGVSIPMVGFLITAFGFACIVMDIPAGRLANRLGRRTVLMAGPVLVIIGSIGCGFAGSFGQLVAFRFIQGVGSAVFTTSAMVMAIDISTPANRGQMMSFYQGSLLLGAGMGPIIGGYAAEYFGLRAPFFVMAGLMVIAGLWAYLRIPETRPSHSDGQQERTPVQRQAHAPITRSSMKSLLLNANFVMVSLLTLLTFFTCTGAQNQILPLLSHDRMGLSESQIGLALTLSMIMQLVIIIVGGRSSDRFGRKAVITPGCIIIVIALVMLFQSYFYWFLLLTCIFIWESVLVLSVPPCLLMSVISFPGGTTAAAWGYTAPQAISVLS